VDYVLNIVSKSCFFMDWSIRSQTSLGFSWGYTEKACSLHT